MAADRGFEAGTLFRCEVQRSGEFPHACRARAAVELDGQRDGRDEEACYAVPVGLL
jgi:hypothetical protein